MNSRRLAFAVLPVVLAAGLGGLGSRRAPSTYARLDKPSWAPPASTFGPVWTALYATIAVAGWRAYTASPGARGLHLAQLALNAAWPGVFFSARDKRASLALIAALDAAVAAEVAALGRDDRLAAALLTPYLGWCGFATALNAAVSEPAPAPTRPPRTLGLFGVVEGVTRGLVPGSGCLKRSACAPDRFVAVGGTIPGCSGPFLVWDLPSWISRVVISSSCRCWRGLL